MNRHLTHLNRMIRSSLAAGTIWLLALPLGAGADIGSYLTDSPAGAFLNPAERNKRDRERILNVLSYQGAIYLDENGKPRVKVRRKLDQYYRSLQDNKALDKVYGFSPNEDPRGEKSDQFWRNFFDGKDWTRGDTPAVMDDFENNSRGLATKMHSQLSTATDEASTDYAITAGELKVRGIDILEKDLRQGVAAGADVYIKALNALTGGTSTKAVEWIEEAAQQAKAISDDPSGAAKNFVQKQVEDLLKNKIDEYKDDMLGQADEALKKILGQKRYDEVMNSFEKYSEGQERLQKIFDTLARVTGDERLADAAKKIEEFSPDAIARELSQKYLPKILQEDKDGNKNEEKLQDGKEPGPEPQPDMEEDNAEEPKVTDDDAKSDPVDTPKSDDSSQPSKTDASAVDSSPGKSTVTKGSVESKDGSRITITDTLDADGNIIRSTETQTDADGKVISQTTYEGGTGEGKTTYPSRDLRDAEPSSGGDVDIDMATGGVNAANVYSSQWTDSQQQRTANSSIIMAQNSQMNESANIGNQQIRDAKTTRDAGGRDARTIQDASARDANKADRENSWGKAIGDAVELGITEGGRAFGQAIGQGASDRVVGEIFGGSKDDPDDSQNSSGTQMTAGTSSPSSDAASDRKKSSDKKPASCEDKPSCTSGCEEDEFATDADLPPPDPSDPIGVASSTRNPDGTITITYGCTYTWTGKPPGPARCPVCNRETVSTRTNTTTESSSATSATPTPESTTPTTSTPAATSTTATAPTTSPITAQPTPMEAPINAPPAVEPRAAP